MGRMVKYLGNPEFRADEWRIPNDRADAISSREIAEDKRRLDNAEWQFGKEIGRNLLPPDLLFPLDSNATIGADASGLDSEFQTIKENK